MFHAIGTSENALLKAHKKINNHYAFAIWQNQQSTVQCEVEHFHTYSRYLENGESIKRVDQQAKQGFTGATCLLPEGSYSKWNISSAPCTFMHFYFSDNDIRFFAAHEKDIEPNSISLPEWTYNKNNVTDIKGVSLFNTLLTAPQDIIAISEAINDFFSSLLTQSHVRKSQYIPKGGLSPATNKRCKQYIQEHFHLTISLEELAHIAQLSPYHFQKMFTHTNAVSPHEYIQRMRIESVKSLIHTAPLNQVALDCGFSHQSHMHRVFKHHVGITPSEYRKLTCS